MEEDQNFHSPVNNSPFNSSDEERESESYDNHAYSPVLTYNGDEISHGFHRGRPYTCSQFYCPLYSPSYFRSPEIFKEDRISPLPDSVIHHILSFLPAEDAVRTGVLSKRWMYLWTSVPKLTFRGRRNYFCNQIDGFLEFVDKTLFFYSSSNVEKFVLDFDYQDANRGKASLDALIHKWVRWATRHDVRELFLKFGKRNWKGRFYNDDYDDGVDGDGSRYPMPQFVFNNASLRKLSTRLCDYAPQGQVSWRSLSNLIIERTELSNDVLERILLGSPMIEYLELHRCWGLTRIDLSSSPMLEYLKVHMCWPLASIHSGSRSRLERLVLKEMYNPQNEEDDSLIEISCSNLKSMEISGSWKRKKCRLLNVSSLMDICLTFEVDLASEEYIDITKQLLQKIKHAKRITLGIWCIQVLSVLEFRGLPSPMDNGKCKCLTLDTDFNSWDTYGVASLLYSLPTLQNLVIDLTKNRCGEEVHYSDNPEFRDCFGQNFWKSERRTFYCLLRHLKTVEIVGLDLCLEAIETIEDDLLAFVRFLLGNARVLKKMVVALEKIGFGREYNSGYLYLITEKLLSFPRCSSRAVVLIKK